MTEHILVDYDKCAFAGCDEAATVLAFGRKNIGIYDKKSDSFLGESEPHGHPWVARYCETHADIVAGEGYPEYVENCPNCGCRFGFRD